MTFFNFHEYLTINRRKVTWIIKVTICRYLHRLRRQNCFSIIAMMIIRENEIFDQNQTPKHQQIWLPFWKLEIVLDVYDSSLLALVSTRRWSWWLIIRAKERSRYLITTFFYLKNPTHKTQNTKQQTTTNNQLNTTLIIARN